MAVKYKVNLQYTLEITDEQLDYIAEQNTKYDLYPQLKNLENLSDEEIIVLTKVLISCQDCGCLYYPNFVIPEELTTCTVLKD